MNAKTTTLTTAAAILVSASGLAAYGAAQSSATQDGTRPGLNRMEHEAHRYLGEMREDQARALNPNEHVAHRGTDEWATDAKPGEQVAGRVAPQAAPTASPADCSAALAQAWQRLGHFSDGYERYLLTQPPCA